MTVADHLSAPPEDAVQPIPVIVPAYDLSALQPAVVHIGVGGFHRAHQAVYFDDLASSGVTDWAVVGVGVSRPRLREVLVDQGCLFTVVQRGSRGSQARVIGVMTDVLLLADEPDRVRKVLADPDIRLVTLTITGDAYHVDAQANPVFDVLVEALDDRRRAGDRGFTVLSCDNLLDAGAAARTATLHRARSRSNVLAEWIDANVTFPGSMVDRITPLTDSEERARIEAEFGVHDASPVVTEPFAQWIIEDSFCNGRPPLERVGVRFVDDVAPYKLIKSRMLNGGHSALAYVGLLTGHRRSNEAMADPDVARFMDALLAQEIAPSLPADIPGMDLSEYRREVLERFANPAIGDTLARLARRGSTKMVDYLLPSLHAARSEGRDRARLVLALTAWVRHLQGRDGTGGEVEVEDARLDELRPLAELAAVDPVPLLSVTDVFGDLAQDEEVVRSIPRLLEIIDRDGVRAALAFVEPGRRRVARRRGPSFPTIAPTGLPHTSARDG